jgi:hypothetical protein
MELNERDWASTQDRKTLTPYIAKALSILDECGFKPTDVTSPWDFGIDVEDEYEYSISRAVKEACGKRKAWFFLRDLVGYENAKPWVALDDGECTLVSIPSTICDHTWDTIVSPRTDDEFIRSIADKLITEDGKGGDIINVLNTGGYPILISHWQCLMSNGTGVGLKVLELVAKRVNTLLSDRVRWMSFEEILDHVLENKSAFPKPHFKK